MRQIQPSSLRALRGIVALAAASVAVQAQAQAPWKIVELKTPPGTFYARPASVDRARNVYGQAQMSVGGIRPVRWLASTNYTPEFVGTQDGWIRGCNTGGYFTGLHEMSSPAGGPTGKPVLWAPDGTFQYLDGLPDYFRADGISINATRAIAGSMITKPDFGYRAFRWDTNGGTLIPTLTDYPYAYGTGINNAGFVVGYGLDSYNAPTISAAWIWTDTGGVQKLPAVGSYYRATGINNTGLVCGFARYSGLGSAVVWPFFGPATILQALPSYPHAEAVGVNDVGDVAGNVWIGKWNNQQVLRPVSWFNGICHDIQAESGITGATLGAAHGINSRGDVVGEAKFGDRQSGFLAIRRN